MYGQNYVAVATTALFAKDRQKSWQIAKTPLVKQGEKAKWYENFCENFTKRQSV